jgi:predicted secreted protein
VLHFGFACVKEIDENANGAIIEAEKNEVLDICLSESRTAGYKWTVRSDGTPVCKPLEDHFVPAGAGLGAKGSHHWQFQCVSSGSASIEFEYARPWEKTVKPVRTFSVEIRVEK